MWEASSPDLTTSADYKGRQLAKNERSKNCHEFHELPEVMRSTGLHRTLPPSKPGLPCGFHGALDDTRMTSNHEFFPAKTTPDWNLNHTVHEWWSKQKRQAPANLPTPTSTSRSFHRNPTKQEAENSNGKQHNPADLIGLTRLGFAESNMISTAHHYSSSGRATAFAPSRSCPSIDNMAVVNSPIDFWTTRYRLEHTGSQRQPRAASAPSQPAGKAALALPETWCSSSYQQTFQGPAGGKAVQPSAKGSRVERARGLSWSTCSPGKLAKLEATWAARHAETQSHRTAGAERPSRMIAV